MMCEFCNDEETKSLYVYDDYTEYNNYIEYAEILPSEENIEIVK